jgi:4-amino-4-deoxy-L-arabinose transferase-like glycosyltransferase
MSNLSSDSSTTASAPASPLIRGKSPLLSLHWLIFIFLVALGLRVGYVVTLPNDAVFADSQKYRMIAANIKAGKGFIESEQRRATRAPEYPLFLALMPGGAEGGESLLPVRLAQSLIGACVCVFVWLIARRLFGMKTALLAAGIAAIYPYHIYFAGVILSEILFMFFMALAVFLLARLATPDGAASKRMLLISLLAGIAIGLATLARASFLLFPFFLLPIWLLVARRRGRALAQWAALIAGVCLAMLPWVWRNYGIYHHLVPTTLQVGESLYEANNPAADGGPMIDRIDWDAEWGNRPMNEYQWDKFFRDKAVTYMREHPARTAQLAFIKLGRFWNPVPNNESFRGGRFIAVSLLTCLPMLLLAICGIYRARRAWRIVLLLLAPVIYYSLMHMIFVGSIRYRIPVDLFLIILAAYALSGWFGWREAGSGKPAAQ